MLLAQASMRPRTREPVTVSETVESRVLRRGSLSSHSGRDGQRESESEALTLLNEHQRPLSRRVSKNCANIKKFGSRLFIRRRQRQAERIVIDDVERMRQALVAMDERLTLLDSITVSMRQNAEAAAMEMVSTYFRYMKHGLNPSEVARDREITKPFLESTMTPDLKCQDFIGLDNFFKQWEYVTKYHAEVNMVNTMMTPLPVESDTYGNDVLVIKCTGVTYCRISRQTLENFFPHIIQNEELVQCLINKQYGYGYTMIQHINSKGKVFQFESSIDLTSALLNLLSDPRITLQMIESSMWTKGGNLRGEVQEEQITIENGYLV